MAFRRYDNGRIYREDEKNLQGGRNILRQLRRPFPRHNMTANILGRGKNYDLAVEKSDEVTLSLFPFTLDSCQHRAFRVNSFQLNIEAPQPRHMPQHFFGLLIQWPPLKLRMP